jgi:hypothetical protein
LADDRKRRRNDGKPRPADLVRAAAGTLAELTGRQPENVLGLQQDEDGWKVMLEVVELHRVPRATDIIGCYVVTVDDDGELVSYERRQRYVRSATGGEG